MLRAVSATIATVAALAMLVAYRPTPEDVPAPAGAGAPSRTAAPTVAPTPAANGPHDVVGPVVQTRFGPVQVRVTLAGGRIVDVQALELPTDRARSAFISQYAGPLLRSEAIQAQKAAIDVVSGATYTSVAYARSLSSAIGRAGL